MLSVAVVALADDQGVWHGWPGPRVPQASRVVVAQGHRLFLIGGVSNPIVWVRSLDDGRGWSQFRTPGSNAPRVLSPALIDDAARDRILVIGPDSATGVVQVHSLDLAAHSWSRLDVGGTPPQGTMWAALDPILDRVVCASPTAIYELRFDEALQWRIWTAGRWPPARSGGALALDTRQHRLLHQGGGDPVADDFREIPLAGGDTTDWQVVPGVTGDQRYDHTGFYDALRDRFVGHGGRISWRYPSYSSWSAALEAPVGVQQISGGYDFGGQLPILDPVGDQLLVFPFNSWCVMWSVPLAGGPRAWTQAEAASMPPLSGYIPAWSRVVLDSRRHRLILFGGAHYYEPANDVWVCSLDSLPQWHVLDVAGARPAPRAGTPAIYDPIRDRLVIHGGNSTTRGYTDTWALSLADPPTWTQVEGGSFFADGDPAVFDPVNDRMLIAHGSPVSVWSYPFGQGIGGRWTEIPTTGAKPPKTAFASSAYDPLRERWLVFGGKEDASAWALDLKTYQWQLLGHLGFANEFWQNAAGDFDLLGDRVVLFGGRRFYNINGNAADQELPVWVRSLSVGGAPSPAVTLATLGPPADGSESRWEVMDPERDALVVAGGPQKADAWTIDWDRIRLARTRYEATEDHIGLGWRSPDLAGQSVELWRRAPYSSWAMVTNLAFDGGGEISYDDASVSRGTRYGYRLRMTDGRTQPVITEVWTRAGTADPDTIVPPPPPPPPPGVPGFSLSVLNPSRDVIAFSIAVSVAQPGKAELFDLRGRRVGGIDLGSVTPGSHPFMLAPATDAAGVYWLRVTVGSQVEKRRIALLR